MGTIDLRLLIRSNWAVYSSTSRYNIVARQYTLKTGVDLVFA